MCNIEKRSDLKKKFQVYKIFQLSPAAMEPIRWSDGWTYPMGLIGSVQKPLHQVGPTK